jgi:hypothetical protein
MENNCGIRFESSFLNGVYDDDEELFNEIDQFKMRESANMKTIYKLFYVPRSDLPDSAIEKMDFLLEEQKRMFELIMRIKGKSVYENSYRIDAYQKMEEGIDCLMRDFRNDVMGGIVDKYDVLRMEIRVVEKQIELIKELSPTQMETNYVIESCSLTGSFEFDYNLWLKIEEYKKRRFKNFNILRELFIMHRRDLSQSAMEKMDLLLEEQKRMFDIIMSIKDRSYYKFPYRIKAYMKMEEVINYLWKYFREDIRQGVFDLFELMRMQNMALDKQLELIHELSQK